jgi:hypothetical protein
MPPARDTESEARILDLHARGFNNATIAHAEGCAGSHVGNVLKRNGLERNRVVRPASAGVIRRTPQHAPKKRRHIAHEDRASTPMREHMRERDAQVRELHAQGLPNADIAKRLGFPLQSVASSLNRLGLMRNGNPKGRGNGAPPPDTSHILTQVVSCQCGIDGCGWRMTATVAETRDAFTRHRTACPIPIVFDVPPPPPVEVERVEPVQRVQRRTLAPAYDG